MANDEQVPIEVGDTAELSRGERKRLRRAAKMLKREKEHSRSQVLRWAYAGAAVAVVVVMLGALVWKVSTAPTRNPADVVSMQEVHWHAKISIVIKGKEMDIPANIGIHSGETHPARMHTHADDHIIHVEKMPPVVKDDVRLKNFFEQWGKVFTPECVLNSCEGGPGKLTMTVNGKETQEFGDYMIADHDEIVITYE
ncbi:MAG: hypothetical protein HY006_02740 [Candidatus Sungbacteria bacterium]|nr:hypothetical protein [Candidatus Sungbacteria bacterium]